MTEIVISNGKVMKKTFIPLGLSEDVILNYTLPKEWNFSLKDFQEKPGQSICLLYNDPCEDGYIDEEENNVEGSFLYEIFPMGDSLSVFDSTIAVECPQIDRYGFTTTQNGTIISAGKYDLGFLFVNPLMEIVEISFSEQLDTGDRLFTCILFDGNGCGFYSYDDECIELIELCYPKVEAFSKENKEGNVIYSFSDIAKSHAVVNCIGQTDFDKILLSGYNLDTVSETHLKQIQNEK